MSTKNLGGLIGTADQSERRFGRIYAPDQSWLDGAVTEAVLEPELEIVDAHHHLFDMPGFRYMFEELMADIDSGHNVTHTIFNECLSMYRASGPDIMKPVGEVEFCAGVAARSESGNYGSTRVNAGIVGFADLSMGDGAKEILEAEMEAGGGRFRGVRYAAAWDEDPLIGNSHTNPRRGEYLDVNVQAGVKLLGKLELSLDAWVFFHQLDDVAALAEACPNTQIVLCHLGGPLGYGPYKGKEKEVFKVWREKLERVAQHPNVYLKLGGVMMRLAAFDYIGAPRPALGVELATIWRPYLEVAVELFTPSRCMVESNFPVDKMGVTYRGLWNAFKYTFQDLSSSEKMNIFSETARRIYRIEEQ